MYLLRSDVKSGRRNEAWISYNSSTHNLSVAFSGLRNNSVVMQGLDYQVDLRQHLPEFVTFGFSMATGVDFAIFSSSGSRWFNFGTMSLLKSKMIGIFGTRRCNTSLRDLQSCI